MFWKMTLKRDDGSIQEFNLLSVLLYMMACGMFFSGIWFWAFFLVVLGMASDYKMHGGTP